MGIFSSFILFIIFVFIYLFIAEIFVMLFRMTGLTKEQARFQVISMLTNSGYTTKEAEIIVNNKIRRKLARFIMIFGYTVTVTIVSAIVNLFVQFNSTFIGSTITLIPILCLFTIIIFLLKQNKSVNFFVNNLIKRIANKIMYGKYPNPIIILDNYGDLVIAKIELKILPESLKNVSLNDSNIRSNHGINILILKTSKSECIPSGSTILNTGNTLVVMGKEKSIHEVFDAKKPKVNAC